MLLSSASSKTAYGTAFQLAQREGIEVIGLTSAANKAFCESLGCYSRVLAYEELDQIAGRHALRVRRLRRQRRAAARDPHPLRRT